MITAAQFKAIFTNCPARKAAIYLPLLIAAMRESQITSRRRAAAFFAQLGHESLDFKYMEESASGDAKDLKQFDKTTRRINGGYNGRVDRQRRYLVALLVLDDKQFEAVRLEQTLSVLTIPTPAPSPEVSNAAIPITPVTEVAPVSTSPITAPGDAGSPATPSPETSLLDEIPVNEQTKAIGVSILRRLGLRIGAAVVLAWASGFLGRAAIVLCVAMWAVVLYRHRKCLHQQVLKIVRKLKGAPQ